MELAERAAGWRSGYVHVPFCRRRCPYCDFAVVTPEESDEPVERYIDALVAEIAMESPWRRLDAVNLGGGTPSTLPPSQLTRILTALEERFGFAPDAEISIEANPEDITPQLAVDLAGVGFTRISLGVQSLDSGVLGALGRHHRPDEAATAVAAARRAGFADVSLDLIYGAAAESPRSWHSTVAAAVALEPDHLSAYALTVEPGTALSREVLAGAAAPDPDVQADAYEHLVTAAAQAGLVHYEVSNFARRGHTCRYNLATWGQGEYVAFGLGAHGHRDGVRRRNVRRLDVYLSTVEAGERPEAGAERLDEWGREQERLILGLRRRAGVRSGPGGAALRQSAEGQRLAEAGILAFSDDHLVVTRPLLTDAVSRAILTLEAGEP